MKNFLFGVAAALLCGTATAQNAIPNPGFETWNVNPNYDDPAGWGTINGLTYILGVKTVTKATGADAHSGSFAIKLESKTVPVQGVAPGIAATGTVNAQTQGIDGGVVFNKRPAALKGWFKYQPNGIDTGSIEATLSRWNSGTGQRETVGRAEFVITSTATTYTQFTANFTYTLSTQPDTLVMILLTSSKANSSPNGTKMFVDDLEFDYCSNYSLTGSTTASTCNNSDGSASVSNVNGEQPFLYSWAGGGSTATINNLAAGAYNVTVVDNNGCTASTSVNVTAVNNPINITPGSTTTNCGSSTGTATATPTNGTSPYGYVWSNSSTSQTIASLGAGSYNVTVTDANGCTGTATASVTTPNGPSASNTVTNVLCGGAATGAVDVVTTGGTAPITYLWNNGSTAEDITGLTAGSYSLTISDNNNCSFVVNASVTEPQGLISGANLLDVSCNGGNDGSIEVTVSGGVTPYSFTLNGAPATMPATGLTAGNYSVVVTDANGCSISNTLSLNEPTALSLSLSHVDATSSTAMDGSATVSASGAAGAPYVYSWNTNPVATTATVNNLPAGNYCVTVTDLFGCNATGCVTVSAPSGINSLTGAAISIYPNPANTSFTIKGEGLQGNLLRLYSVTGALQLEQQIQNNTQSINVTALPQGIYTYKLLSPSNEEIVNGRIVISR